MAAITLTGLSTALTRVVTNGGLFTPNDLGARVKVATFSYTSTASVAATSVLALARLPAGASILAVRVDSDNDTATSTLAVGYTATSSLVDTNAAAFIAATAASSGATTLSLKATAVLTALTAESYVIATVGTAAHASGKTIKGYVLYLDGGF